MKKSFALFIAISTLIFTSILVMQNHKLIAISMDNISREYLKNEAQLIIKSMQKIIKNELNKYILNQQCIDEIKIELNSFVVLSNIYYFKGVNNCSKIDDFIFDNNETFIMIDYSISSTYNERKLLTITKREYTIIHR